MNDRNGFGYTCTLYCCEKKMQGKCRGELRTFLMLQATASKIDHLDGALRGVLKQNVLPTVQHSDAMRWANVVPPASDRSEQCGGASSKTKTSASDS